MAKVLNFYREETIEHFDSINSSEKSLFESEYKRYFNKIYDSYEHSIYTVTTKNNIQESYNDLPAFVFNSKIVINKIIVQEYEKKFWKKENRYHRLFGPAKIDSSYYLHQRLNSNDLKSIKNEHYDIYRFKSFYFHGIYIWPLDLNMYLKTFFCFLNDILKSKDRKNWIMKKLRLLMRR